LMRPQTPANAGPVTAVVVTESGHVVGCVVR
jgi:hypothetical protein